MGKLDTSSSDTASGSGWMRTDPAAAYCERKRRTFEGYRSEGGGPEFSKKRGLVLYHIDDLDTWLASGRRSSTAEAS